MRQLYFDCFSGASGDMILGSLLDAGLKIEDLRQDLSLLGLDGFDFRIICIISSIVVKKC